MSKPSKSLTAINSSIQTKALSDYASYITNELTLKVILEESKDVQEILKKDKSDIDGMIAQLNERLEHLTNQWKTTNPDYKDEIEYRGDCKSLMNNVRERAKISGIPTYSEINVVWEMMTIKGDVREILNKGGVKIRSIEEGLKKSSQNLHSNGMEDDDESAAELLKRFLIDMRQKAKDGDYNEMIGREEELQSVIQVLSRKSKNNPILVGEAGVGKTSIAEGLALAFENGTIHESLKDYRLLSLDINGLISGTKYRGELERRLEIVIKHISDGKTIVFIDEIHSVSTSESGSSSSIVNTLKPHLTNGKVRVIGTTTIKEYRTHFEKDAALSRRFNKISVEQLSKADTLTLMHRVQESYEKAHNVKYAVGVVDAIVDLTARFIFNKQFPDKAIDILDEAGAFVKLNYENKLVDVSVVQKIIARISKQPVENIETTSGNGNLRELSNKLSSKIFGQEDAIKRVTDSVILSQSGFGDEEKPLGSFLFVGPTGVGKTELAKQLAENLSMKLIRFDMSEYSDATGVSKMIGSSAGFVGHEDGGVLTEKINENPYAIVLFDEIEKADRKVYNLLLQVLDYGFLTDGAGRKVDFRNTLIIFTSNAGVKGTAREQRTLSVTGGTSTVAKEGSSHIDQKLLEAAFSPEFRNRLDGIVEFKSITQSIVLDIVNKAIEPITQKIQEKGYTLNIDDTVISDIVKRGFKPEFGAREVNRTVKDRLALPLAKALTFGSIIPGSKIYVTLDGEEIVVANKTLAKDVDVV